MIVDILLSHREDDILWHSFTTTRARSIKHAFAKARRIAPFSTVKVLSSKSNHDIFAGDEKGSGKVISLCLPEHNDGLYADRVHVFKDGKHQYDTDLTLMEEDGWKSIIRDAIEGW